MKTVSTGKRNQVTANSIKPFAIKAKPTTKIVIEAIESKTEEASTEIGNYDFENLVFEGGGNKGLAYVGAVMVSRLHLISPDFLKKQESCQI